MKNHNDLSCSFFLIGTNGPLSVALLDYLFQWPLHFFQLIHTPIYIYIIYIYINIHIQTSKFTIQILQLIDSSIFIIFLCLQHSTTTGRYAACFSVIPLPFHYRTSFSSHKVVPPSSKWLIIPLSIVISPTKTIVKLRWLRRQLQPWTLWLRTQPWTSWPRFQTMQDMVKLTLLWHQVLEDCQHWRCTSRRQRAHKLLHLPLQQEIPLWQEKDPHRVCIIGHRLRWYHHCHRHHRQHRWEARQGFVWHAKGVDCWTRKWTCDCSALSEQDSSVWRGRLPKSHLRPQLRQLQIPLGLVTGPKSVQASVDLFAPT